MTVNPSFSAASKRSPFSSSSHPILRVLLRRGLGGSERAVNQDYGRGESSLLGREEKRFVFASSSTFTACSLLTGDILRESLRAFARFPNNRSGFESEREYE